MATFRTDLCRLRPQDTVSIDFSSLPFFFEIKELLKYNCVTVFVIRDTLAQQTYDVTSTFTSCILNYLNNRFHCSPNNSLLSFSANDWLKFVAAILNFNSAPDWLKFQVAILDLENIRFHSSPNNCLLPFSAPDWLKFQVAILDLENIRFHSSPNNCLLPFSAPDWLLLKPSGYTTCLELKKQSSK